MVTCCVIGCSKRTGRDVGISYFRFPRLITNLGIKCEAITRKRRKLWVIRVSRADLPEDRLKHSRVCSLHFIKGKPADLFDENNPDWAPTLALGYDRLQANSATGNGRDKSRDNTLMKITGETLSKLKYFDEAHDISDINTEETVQDTQPMPEVVDSIFMADEKCMRERAHMKTTGKTISEQKYFEEHDIMNSDTYTEETVQHTQPRVDRVESILMADRKECKENGVVETVSGNAHVIKLSSVPLERVSDSDLPSSSQISTLPMAQLCQDTALASGRSRQNSPPKWLQ